jgi:hypothetical protein
MITLNEQHIKELEAFANELPMKYGVPLLQFFNNLLKEQQEAQEEEK